MNGFVITSFMPNDNNKSRFSSNEIAVSNNWCLTIKASYGFSCDGAIYARQVYIHKPKSNIFFFNTSIASSPLSMISSDAFT
jgi:hypothetical protein